MATRYFLFLTNCYHQPPQAASGKRTEPVVATVGVSHSPRRGKLPRARGGPTVSSACPATKLKPARTQTQNGLLSTQPTHRKTSAFYSTIRVGGWSGETPTVISAGHPTLEMESDGFVFKASLKCAHTDTRARFVCVCACMCTHMYKCLRMYAYIDMSN